MWGPLAWWYGGFLGALSLGWCVPSEEFLGVGQWECIAWLVGRLGSGYTGWSLLYLLHDVPPDGSNDNKGWQDRFRCCWLIDGVISIGEDICLAVIVAHVVCDG